MGSQTVMIGERVAHVRELKAEVARLKSENARLAREHASLRAHFDLALASAAELRTLRPAERLELWDGWNLILGADKIAHSREELIDAAKVRLAAGDAAKIWIILDGSDAQCINAGALRVSYTGGTGEQRADRFIVDFCRMAQWLDLAQRISVFTHDKGLLAQVKRLGVSGYRDAQPG